MSYETGANVSQALLQQWLMIIGGVVFILGGAVAAVT